MADKQRRAYQAGGKAVRRLLAERDPKTHERLSSLEKADIVVVSGTMDHVEWVLEALGLSYRLVAPGRLPRARLRPDQTVIVNCPGVVPAEAVGRVRTFVEEGGRLFTTDWALRNLLEPAFPGYVAYNDCETGDEVVPIRPLRWDHPLLAGMMDGPANPQWWLENASYPIKVIDQGVEVLLTSWQLEERYGEEAVAVKFGVGRGDVIHMISHYYLQRTELRDERHRLGAKDWFTEHGLTPEGELDDLSLGALESAVSSARFLANVVGGKERKAA